MTPDQLKELENLNERWANPDNFKNDTAITHAVMDLLPDVLAHVRQLEIGIHELEFGKYGRSQLTFERDAALKAAAELLSWATMLANDARDCAAAVPGKLAITLHGWFERDHQPDKPWGNGYVPKAELDAAIAACGLAHAERITGGAR